MLWALRYDMHYTKDEILTAYLTLTPYGGNVEGIEAASLVYFGKHASQLTAAESIALSVVPRTPSSAIPSRVRTSTVHALPWAGRRSTTGL